jgi:bifunctional UDP-N-acetylglucosamine pyrophosphorylase/glucosamine-1-phosphate N-acetyltransferase
LDKLPAGIEGYYAVVYNDTPLITEEFLKLLAEECEALRTSYRLGDGFITKKGYEGSFKSCQNVLATQVQKLCDISFISSFMKKFVLDRVMKKNILVYDPATTFIDVDVEIEDGVILHPMTTLRGKTKIGRDTVVFSGCELIDTVVGKNVDLRATYALEAKVGDYSTVGPYACLRPKAVVGSYCRVGDFVEIKNSNIGSGVKMAHLAYVGYSDVGENTNIGCGAVFANYNGQTKSRCKVGSNVFIGANSNLVAPVVVHDGAYLAAGGTITKDVPAGNLCIARSRQVFKENWERK